MDIRDYKRELESQFPEASKKVKNDLALQIGNEVERHRVAYKLTQAGLAKKVGTQQSGISRLERGTTLPSLRFLRKIANALEMYVECKFYPFVSPIAVLQISSPRTMTSSISNVPSNSSELRFAFNGHSDTYQISNNSIAK